MTRKPWVSERNNRTVSRNHHIKHLPLANIYTKFPALNHKSKETKSASLQTDNIPQPCCLPVH